MSQLRDEVKIKVPILHRIFVCHFHDYLASEVTFVAVGNTGKKTIKMGILIRVDGMV